tara:strand:- start:28689 stop:29666 length:978 start_codon:yes stop_codon:yes gene_type:complete
MKKFIFILIFLCISNVEAQYDHLEPMQGVLNGYSFQVDYHQVLREKLGFDKDYIPIIRYVVTPSFDIEYALEILSDNGTFFVKNLTFSENIWYSKKRDKIKLKKKRRIISSEDVELLDELFKTAIYAAKFSKSRIAISDGTRYIFSVFDYGLYSAQKHSPEKGTKIYELKEISELLVLETSKNKFKNISITLKNRIINLIYKFILYESGQEELTKYKIQKAIINHLNSSISFDEKGLYEYPLFDYVYHINKEGTLEIKLRKYKNQTEEEYQKDLLLEKARINIFKENLSNLKLPKLIPLKTYEIKINLEYDSDKKRFTLYDLEEY